MKTRKLLMRIRLRLLLIPICAITAAVGIVAVPSSGMTNGQKVAPEKWNAMVFWGGHNLCSGALVGNGWVLSAAHCLFDEKGNKLSLSGFSIAIAKTSASSSDGALYTVDNRTTIMPNYVAGQQNDAALFHLANFPSDRWNAIPLAFEDSVVNGSGEVSFYGYGSTGWVPKPYHTNKQVEDGTLLKSPDKTIFRAPNTFCWAAAFSCFTSDGFVTRLMNGDSGGPLVRKVSGAWQLIAVADNVHSKYRDESGSPAGATSTLQWVGAPTVPTYRMLNWVRDTMGVQAPQPGTILQNQLTGTSWLVATDGYRNWIPTGDDFNCFRSQGHQLISEPQVVIDETPDRVGTWATCTPPPSQLWWEQETPNHPVNTFLNYHNASGMGAPIAAGQWVQVSCKVYDPYIASVNPDGYWYRIASSPWNNAYYAPANTFMNGDPYGGPYTQNTDFGVPNC
jgi:hypothetical protein